MRRSITVLAAAVLTVSVGVFGAPSAQAQGGVTASQVQGAINTVSQLTNSSANVASTSDADSAAITNVNGTQVDVPKNQAGNVQVSMTGGCGTVGVKLPTVTGPQNGTVTAPGVVSFPSGGNFANAVQADDTGGVRFAVVLANAQAPEEFDYEFDLPNGSSIVKEADGSVSIHTPSGVCSIAPSWAYDASGHKVFTQYLTDGYNGVSLIVNHWGENVTYPITADPRWVQQLWYGGVVIHFTRAETNNIASGLTLAGVVAGKWWYIGVPFGVAGWWASQVYQSGKCLAAHVMPGYPWASWYWSENC